MCTKLLEKYGATLSSGKPDGIPNDPIDISFSQIFNDEETSGEPYEPDGQEEQHNNSTDMPQPLTTPTKQPNRKRKPEETVEQLRKANQTFQGEITTTYRGSLDVVNEPFTMCDDCSKTQDIMLNEGQGGQVICDHNWQSAEEIDRNTIAKDLLREFITKSSIAMDDGITIVGIAQLDFTYVKGNAIHRVEGLIDPHKDVFNVQTRSVQNVFCQVSISSNNILYMEPMPFATRPMYKP